MTLVLSPEKLSQLSKSELLAHGYELLTTYPRRGSRVITIKKIVTTATASVLKIPRNQKSWKKILEESMVAHTKSSELDLLCSAFLYRIIPTRIRGDLKEAIHELEYFREYGKSYDYLNSLNQKGALSGLEYSNYMASKKYSLDDRAKFLSDKIFFLLEEIKKSKDYSL